MSLIEAQSADITTLIREATASAKVISTGLNVEITEATGLGGVNQPGVYKVAFKTVKGTAVVVEATIKTAVVIDTETEETISANDFTMSLLNAQSADIATLIGVASASAKVTSTGVSVEITEVIGLEGISQPGVYKVTFRTVKGTRVVVETTIKTAVITNPEMGEIISANDFTMSLLDAQSADVATLIRAASASAKVDITGVNVEITEVMGLEGIIQHGAYKVAFKTVKGTEVIVDATIKTAVAIDPVMDETISANDFTMSLLDAQSATRSDLIRAAKASAKVTTTGVNVEITEATGLEEINQPGGYKVAFKTVKGTAVVVEATIKTAVIVDPETAETIIANNFTLSLANAQSADTKALVEAAVASAKVTTTGEVVEITEATGLEGIIDSGVYSVTFKTAKGTQAIVDATIRTGVVVDPLTGETIIANNFTLSLAAAQSADIVVLVGAAVASAKVTTTGEAVEITDATGLGTIMQPGVYKVTFKTAKGTQTVVDATINTTIVINPETSETIMANDFIMSLAEAQSGNLETVITAAKASAKITATGVSVEITEAGGLVGISQPGDYKVTFKTATGTQATVDATIKTAVATNPEVGETISADNFTMSLFDAQNANAIALITAAKASAKVTVTGEAVEIVEAIGLDQITQPGDYKLTFRTAKGTQAVVDAIIKTTVIINPEMDETIMANDFTMSLVDAQNSDIGELITAASASAKVISTGEAVGITFATELTGIIQSGVYKITFRTTKGTMIVVDAIIRTTIVNDPQTTETLMANDFTMSVADAQSADIRGLITAAGASAKVTETGVAVDITEVMGNEQFSWPGEYNITFKTEKGTEVTVNATLKTAVVVDLETAETLMANEFTMSLTDAQNADISALVRAASASARLTATGEVVEITGAIGLAGIKQPGEYPITFKTAHGTEVVVGATIKTTVVINPQTGETIGANEFAMSLTEAQNADTIALITATKASAKITATGEVVKIIEVTQLKEITQPGQYPVTFKTAAGTEATVEATIRTKVIVDPQPNEIIMANDFTMSLKDIQSADIAVLIRAANASAKMISTGEAVEITEVSGHREIIHPGRANLTFKTTKGTEVSVDATIKTVVVIDPQTDEMVTANDFTISLKDAQSADTTALITAASATAKATETGIGIEITEATGLTEITQLGTYKVIFKTASGTQVIVDATVKTAVTTNEEKREIISANDFMISYEEAKSATATELISRATATAITSENHNEIGITKTTLLADITEGGAYQIIFSTEAETKVEVTAKVGNRSAKYLLSANNITVDIYDVDQNKETGTLEATILAATDAKATNVETNEIARNVRITPESLEKIKTEGGMQVATLEFNENTTANILRGELSEAEPKFNGIHSLDIEITVTHNPPTVEVNQILSGKNTKISGTATAGSLVQILLPNSQIIEVESKDETWEIIVAEELLADQTIMITATDKFGGTSKTQQITVISNPNLVKPEPPIFNPIRANQTVITGQSQLNTTVNITLPNGETISTETSNQTWEITVKITLIEGQIITATATTANGITSDTATTVVLGTATELPQTGEPTNTIGTMSATLILLGSLIVAYSRKKRNDAQ
ncbi:MAG: LPXTG cell wall anchor domain-containing protein [Culicoidibacterales bacterium]